VGGYGNIRISGIGFTSATTMTDGALVRFIKILRSVFTDLHFSCQDGNTNAWHGAWFDGVDYVTLVDFQAKAQADGIRVNGKDTVWADLYLMNGKVGGCTVGLRMGGAFGGLQVDQCGIINNKTNVVIDRTITDAPNREVTFGPNVAIDSASSVLDAATFDGINVDVQDTSGFIFFRGTWNASCGTGIRVDSGSSSIIKLDDGFIYNCVNADGGTGRGIDNASTSAVIIVNGTRFKNCDTAGIYSR
jgi:hypothetical protein